MRKIFTPSIYLSGCLALVFSLFISTNISAQITFTAESVATATSPDCDLPGGAIDFNAIRPNVNVTGCGVQTLNSASPTGACVDMGFLPDGIEISLIPGTIASSEILTLVGEQFNAFMSGTFLGADTFADTTTLSFNSSVRELSFNIIAPAAPPTTTIEISFHDAAGNMLGLGLIPAHGNLEYVVEVSSTEDIALIKICDDAGVGTELVNNICFGDGCPNVTFTGLPAADTTVECGNIPEIPVVTATSDQPVLSPFAFISEFHYDNAGGDTGEFVELTGLAGTDLSDYSIVLYNGSNGTVYNTMMLSGFIDDEIDGFGAVEFDYPSNGIQNGGPDGIALVFGTDSIVEFISYEGSFTAVGGPADGVTSTDVGVSETGGTPIGESLQRTLQGTPGCSGDAFTWTGPSPESPGSLNDGTEFDPSQCAGDSDVGVMITSVRTDGACEGEFTITRTFTASLGPDCGDTSFVQTINVIDTTPPVFDQVLADTTVACDSIPDAGATATDNCLSDDVWINEFHYDNTGADTGEFVELAGTAGFDLMGYEIVLYNGNGGAIYNMSGAMGIIPDEGDGFGAIAYPIPGIQNGSPDGIALVDPNGTVVLFISYEGDFVATDGPAAGMMAMDVMVNEPGATPVGESLQLLGDGSTYTDFTWDGPLAESPGTLNVGQTISGTIDATVTETIEEDTNDTDNVISTITREYIATDDCGNADTLVQIITVIDTVAPALVCSSIDIEVNGDGTFSLSQDDIDEIILGTSDVCSDFTAVAGQVDFDCNDIDVETELASVTVTVTDDANNADSCTVDLNILPASIEFNYACITEINVTLDEDCNATLLPEMVLAGDEFCFDLLDLRIVVQDSDTTNGPIVDGCGQFTYTIREVDGALFNLSLFDNCWGFVNAEDKLSPVLVDSIESPAELFCDDLEAINLNNLPNNVSRCFTVNSAGDPAIGFYQTALGQRLAAGSANGLIPGFEDGCSGMEICVNDIVTGSDACEDIVITRTFTAVDGDCESVAGEENLPTVYSYEITFTAPTLATVDIDTEGAEFECDDTFVALPNGNPAPAADDYPFITRADGTVIFLDEDGYCNLGASFTDGPRITTCENTFKFVRTWTVIDWCDVTNQETFTQLVKVGDFTAPVITAPTQDLDFNGIPDDGPLFYSTNTPDCQAVIQIPAGSAADNCDGDPNVTVFIFPFGDDTALAFGPYAVGEFTFGGIPRGTHLMRYVATDDCGNESTVDVDITIGDATAPFAICEDGLNISIGGPVSQAGNGTAQLCAEDVDRASADDCSDIFREIRITQINGVPVSPFDPLNQWQECHTLTCAELGDVRVELRVTDDGNDDGLFQPGVDNSGICWLDVLVEDKLSPVCIAPVPMTVTCADLDQGFPQDLNVEFANDPIGTAALLDAQFGEATGLDNCPGAAITQSVIDNRNSCGVGTIIRTFTVTDAQNLTSPPGCTQTITVEGIHDYTIIFPGDEESDDCVEPDYNAVEYVENGCDLLTVATTIDTFSATADECYKLRITYEVLNWCEYNTIDPAYEVPRDADNDGNVEEITVVHVIPFGSGLADDVAFLDRDTDRNNNNFINEVDTGDGGILPGSDVTGYGQDGSRGAWTYEQFIKVYDDTPPTLTINEEEPICEDDGDCVEDVVITFTIDDECSPDNVDYFVFLDQFSQAGGDGILTLAEFEADVDVTDNVVPNGGGTFTLTLTDIPLGMHAIRVRATDGCGNNEVDLIEFTVIDCKAPTPICINGLTATLMPDGNGGGMAEIWATDFLASPSSDCSEPIKYSIYRDDEASAPSFPGPNTAITGLTLTCEDLGTLMIRIYSIDGEGNYDYCLTTLEVQAFSPDVCEPGNALGSVAGDIMTEQGEAVSGVEVSITGNSTVQTVTNNQGQFGFQDLLLGDDYTLFPYLDSDHMNGVSTQDILIISRHILGIQPLTNNYQLIAADANNSKAITVIDIITIRKLILGLETDFDNNTSWRFVDASYVFPEIGNPWVEIFPEVANFNNLAGNEFAQFVAVKTGDVSGDADPQMATNFQQPDTEGRSAVNLQTEVEALNAGAITTVPVYAAAGLTGLQSTIELAEGVELVEVLDGQAAADVNFGYNLIPRGLLTFSYAQPQGEIDTDTPLFSLVVRSSQDKDLLDALAVNSAYTAAEAYQSNGTVVSLNLVAVGNTVDAVADALYQNTPNPVNSFTTIGFDLAKAGQATVTINDINGRVLLTRQIDATAGYNSLRLEIDELGATGVLSYTVVSGDFTATKQMVVIR